MPTPRFPIVYRFPVETLAPYVGIPSETVAWCAEHGIGTIDELRRALRRHGRLKRSELPGTHRAELLRLFDPPGLPMEWPLHPDADHRAHQQVAHLSCGLGARLRKIWFNANDRWLGFLYVVHFEEYFTQYKGIGPGYLPRVLAWRDNMRSRHQRPEQVLTAEALQGRIFGIDNASCQHPANNQPSSFSGFKLRIDLELEGNDPRLLEKFLAIMSLPK